MPIKFQSPSDIAFNISGFDIYYYGIVLAFAILAGFITAYKLCKKYYNIEYSEFITDYSPYLIIVGIIGARLYYCAINFSYYIGHPLEILNIRQGGLSIHGMILAGAAGLYIFAKHKKLSFLKLADIYLCSSLLAQSIGRWGNFFNSEAFGYPADVLWKLYIPISKRPLEYINCEYFHPTFLYESILDFLGFIVLLILYKKCSKYSGLIASLYLLIYSSIRIFTESFRIDSALNISGIPIAQIVSSIFIVVSLIFITIIYKRNNT